jgi:hypothetical protein
MKLSSEKARQLTVLVWRERVRRIMPLLLIMLGLIGGFAFLTANRARRIDQTIDVQTHEGTVVNIKRGSPARGAFIVHARLHDGREIDAFSTLRIAPPAGANVLVNEARHASGRYTFEIVRLAE